MISPTASLTYYAVAFDTITGCSSMPDSINVIVNAIPVITTNSSPKGLCPPGGMVSLVGNCVQSNIIIEWYHTPVRTGIPMNAGGTPNGMNYDLFVSNTDSFYGFAVNQLTGCVSSFSMVTIYVLDAPTLLPFLEDSMVRCGNTPITILANITPSRADNSVKWYLNNITDSSYFATRNPLVYTPTHPSYLYAFAINTLSGCVNSSYDSLFIDTASIPLSPSTIRVIPTFICSGDSSLLSVASVDPSLEVRWFTSSSSAGTPIASGNPITVRPLVTTTYYAYMYNPASGCYSNTSSRATVTIYAKPNAGVDKYACQYSTVQMSAVGSAVWSAMAGNPSLVSFSSTSSAIAIVSGLVSEGTYGLIRTNSSGCTDTAFIFVTSKPSAGMDQIACGGSEIILSGAGSIAGTWSSYIRNPIGSTLSDSISDIARVNYSESATGTFKYIYNVAGCTDTNSISVTAKPIAGIDKIICQNSNVLLSGTGAGTWSAVATNPAIVSFSSSSASTPTLSGFTAIGTYTFIRSSATGCTDTVSVLVNEKPNAGVDQLICNGGTVLLSGVSLTPGIWSSYAANPIGAALAIDSSAMAIATFSSSALGTYRFIYTLEACSDTSLIVAGAKPNAGIDKSIRCYVIDTARMSATGIGSWSVGIGSAGTATIVSRTSISTKVCNFSNAGVYYMIWTNANGCSDTAIITANDTCICPISNNILSFPPSSSYCLNTGMLELTGNTALPLIGLYLWQYDDGTGFTNAPGINNMQNYNTSLGRGNHLFRRVFYTNTGILCSDTSTSILVMVHDTSASTINASICSNESYYFNGQAIHSSGSYKDTIQNVFGCDSIVTLVLNVALTNHEDISASVCQYETYLFNEQELNVAGDYEDTFSNAAGCDSFVTLHLEIIRKSGAAVDVSICHDETYNFHGLVLNATGAYYDTLSNINHCDSIITLNLFVAPLADSSVEINLCNGQSYTFHGIEIRETSFISDTLLSIFGCDSIFSLQVNVGNNAISNTYASICEYQSYLFDGQQKKLTGIYSDTVIRAGLCDSIAFLHLTVFSQSSQTINQTLCEGSYYIFNDEELTTSGVYFDTLVNVAGCDSFVNLDLRFNSFYFVSNKPIICQGSSVDVGMHHYDVSGEYEDTFVSHQLCDSIIHTSLIVLPNLISYQTMEICPGQTASLNGRVISVGSEGGVYSDTFTSNAGCDSIIVTTILTLRAVYTTMDTSICEGDLFNGVNYVTNSVFTDTIRSSFGCDSLISIYNIKIKINTPLMVSADTTICEGSSLLLMANGGNDTLKWSASDPLLPLNYTNTYSVDETNTSTLLTTPTSNTLYIVSSRLCDGRIISESVTVNVKEPPKFKLTNRDTCINLGQELTLETTNELLTTDNLTWFLDGKAICLNCPNFTLKPSKAGNYLAMLEDMYGCSSIDSVDVCVTNECLENSFKIPNYITPNGDGNNDNFRFLNPENLTIVSLKIYDRWGEKIFESTAQNPEWDGTFGGRTCSPGSYVYTIEAVCGMQGNIIKSGNVSILR
jgi:gliding motility-associated-like protein